VRQLTIGKTYNHPMPLVTFLRGVNVGGYRRFRPSILAQQLSPFGLVNIGAAGTFVTTKPVSPERLRSELLARLPFAAHVMICTGKELTTAASSHPFDGTPSRFEIIRFVSVLAKAPPVRPRLPMQIPEHGKWLVKILTRHERFVFGLYRREMKAISCLGAMDKVFGVPVTTRNWNTIAAILRLLQKT
jgi:uncharacterized protein (DUF1697 family)